MLDWLPEPDSFAARLRAANLAESPAERLSQLRVLAQSRLGFIETIQLNRALEAAAPVLGELLPRHRLAVIGSTTLDHLAPGIRVAGLRRGLYIEVWTGGYGQYRQDVMDAESQLHHFQPQTTLFSLAAEHVVPDIDVSSSAAETDAQLQQIAQDIRALWAQVRDDLGSGVIQQTLLDLSPSLFGNFDRLVPTSPSSLVESLNRMVFEHARTDRVALLDLARACQRDGCDAWHDTARMLQAKQEIAPQAVPAYGELVARIVCAQRGLSRKCLVLDLDNTLWGGVLGDDGMTGLTLGQGNAAGEAHLALQRYARQLKSRGIILAICSKNDPKIAAEAFASHPEMLLRPGDIAAFVANWQDKAANLIAIAKQLNIGTDSLVFVDDNPAERARVREALPEVAVPELPDDVAGYVRQLAAAGYFEATAFTADDQQRSAQYAENARREAFRESVPSIDEYLRSLRMSVAHGPVAAVDLPRIHQLINKTNQFNTTTRRYSPEQLQALLSRAGVVALQFRLHDRFGDNGLVSALILAPVEGRSACAEIDTWVMSCRVFGRQLEHAVMNLTVEAAQRAGYRELTALYLPTPKNNVIRELFPGLGFAPADASGLPEAASRWSLEMATYRPHTTHITRSSTHDN